ncbi:MAG: translation initiation factor IF-3 [Gammaproteobacteria bacterium]|nr:translation initiation factor IF-3 [Gammaproteobacteria bacterium]
MKKCRINNEIKSPKVRLIDQEGEQVGVVDIRVAQSKAKEVGLDLVEVSPQADPPVCKILDYNRLRYQKKKELTKNKSKKKEVKEIKLRPVTDKNDVMIKTKKIIDFLQKGHRVKVSIFYRRKREVVHQDLSANVLDHIIAATEEFGKVETPPKLEGRNTMMILVPKKAS